MGRTDDVERAGASRDRAEAMRRPQTILLVDDEPDILESLKDILEATSPNIRVVPVLGGTEGLEVLRREPVALILSDYKMPGMNGVEFLRRARALCPDTPSVLITAFPETEVAIKAINEAGVEYFVTKPFSPGTAITVVHALLAEHRARAMREGSFERAQKLLEAQAASRGRTVAVNVPGPAADRARAPG